MNDRCARYAGCACDRGLLATDSLELSKRTHIPSTTVYNRIKRLEKEGIIEGYSIRVNNKLLGLVQAFIEVSLPPTVDTKEFVKKIKPKVDEIYSVAGDYQLMIKSTFNDLGGVYSLTALLQQMKVTKIKTTVILDEL